MSFTIYKFSALQYEGEGVANLLMYCMIILILVQFTQVFGQSTIIDNLDEIADELQTIRTLTEQVNIDNTHLIIIGMFIAAVAVSGTIASTIIFSRQVNITKHQLELVEYEIKHKIRPFLSMNTTIKNDSDINKRFIIKLKNIGSIPANNVRPGFQYAILSDKEKQSSDPFMSEEFKKYAMNYIKPDVMAMPPDYSINVPCIIDDKIFDEIINGNKFYFEFAVKYDQLGKEDAEYMYKISGSVNQKELTIHKIVYI